MQLTYVKAACRTLAKLTLDRGSQTQIHRQAAYGGKKTPQAAVYSVRRALQAEMWMNMSYLVRNSALFEHFQIFHPSKFNF